MAPPPAMLKDSKNSQQYFFNKLQDSQQKKPSHKNKNSRTKPIIYAWFFFCPLPYSATPYFFHF